VHAGEILLDPPDLFRIPVGEGKLLDRLVELAERDMHVVPGRLVLDDPVAVERLHAVVYLDGRKVRRLADGAVGGLDRRFHLVGEIEKDPQDQ